MGNALALLGRQSERALGGSRSARDSLIDRADAAYDRALQLAPANALILVDQARSQIESHRADAALGTARRIVDLYPDAATGHALTAAAWVTMDRPDSAHAALERALTARWEDGSDAERAAAERLVKELRTRAPHRQ